MDKIIRIINDFEKGNHQSALKEYELILHSGTSDEKWLLGMEMFQLGFLEEAERLFLSLHLDYPNEGDVIIALAEVYIEQGREDEAIEILNQIADHDPAFPESLLLQADLYQMEGLYEVSEQKLLTAQEVLPKEHIITFALGELYLEQGRFIEAIRAYEEVLNEHEELAGVNVHQRLGDAYSAGGAFEKAMSHYEKALDGQLELNTLFQYALTAFQAGQNKTAIAKFQELKALDHEYHSLYLYLAKAYEREGELEEAFLTVQEGLKYDEFNKDLFFFGGSLAKKRGDLEVAEKLFKEALALEPDFIEAGLSLNDLYLSLERYEEVLDISQSLSADELDEGKLLWDEAIAYKHLEQYSQALNKYDHAYNYLKNDPEFLRDYGYFLIEEGKKEQAREIFIRLLNGDPTNEEYVEVVQSLTDEYV